MLFLKFGFAFLCFHSDFMCRRVVSATGDRRMYHNGVTSQRSVVDDCSRIVSEDPFANQKRMLLKISEYQHESEAIRDNCHSVFNNV